MILVSDHPSQVICVGYYKMNNYLVNESIPAENKSETILNIIIQRIWKCRCVCLENQASSGDVLERCLLHISIGLKILSPISFTLLR